MKREVVLDTETTGTIPILLVIEVVSSVSHGRPTYIELKRKDVEILFGRR